MPRVLLIAELVSTTRLSQLIGTQLLDATVVRISVTIFDLPVLRVIQSTAARYEAEFDMPILESLKAAVILFGEDTTYSNRTTALLGERYEPLNSSGPSCQYQINGQPACLIGVAMYLDGIEYKDEWDEYGGRPIGLLAEIEGLFTSHEVRILEYVQDEQDKGKTWGQAVANARKIYGSF